jgi:hypothetical protein
MADINLLQFHLSFYSALDRVSVELEDPGALTPLLLNA